MELTRPAEQQIALEMGWDVREVLRTISENAGRIKQGLALLGDSGLSSLDSY